MEGCEGPPCSQTTSSVKNLFLAICRRESRSSHRVRQAPLLWLANLQSSHFPLSYGPFLVCLFVCARARPVYSVVSWPFFFIWPLCVYLLTSSFLCPLDEISEGRPAQPTSRILSPIKLLFITSTTLLSTSGSSGLLFWLGSVWHVLTTLVFFVALFLFQTFKKTDGWPNPSMSPNFCCSFLDPICCCFFLPFLIILVKCRLVLFFPPRIRMMNSRARTSWLFVAAPRKRRPSSDYRWTFWVDCWTRPYQQCGRPAKAGRVLISTIKCWPLGTVSFEDRLNSDCVRR